MFEEIIEPLCNIAIAFCMVLLLLIVTKATVNFLTDKDCTKPCYVSTEQTNSQPSNMKYCSNCGHELSTTNQQSSAKYCPDCGRELSTDNQTITSSENKKNSSNTTSNALNMALWSNHIATRNMLHTSIK